MENNIIEKCPYCHSNTGFQLHKDRMTFGLLVKCEFCKEYFYYEYEGRLSKLQKWIFVKLLDNGGVYDINNIVKCAPMLKGGDLSRQWKTTDEKIKRLRKATISRSIRHLKKCRYVKLINSKTHIEIDYTKPYSNAKTIELTSFGECRANDIKYKHRKNKDDSIAVVGGNTGIVYSARTIVLRNRRLQENEKKITSEPVRSLLSEIYDEDKMYPIIPDPVDCYYDN